MKFVGNFTNAMKEYCEEKVARLEKYNEISNLLSDIRFKLSKVGNNFKLEIQLGSELRSSSVGPDFYVLVVEVVEKLDGQIRRYRTTKIFTKKHQPEKYDQSYNPEEEEIKIMARKFTICDLLTEEEAIEKMDALDFDFFAYKDIDEESKMCIMYRRHDGLYGKIICA